MCIGTTSHALESYDRTTYGISLRYEGRDTGVMCMQLCPRLPVRALYSRLCPGEDSIGIIVLTVVNSFS